MELVDVEIDKIEDNPLSANIEDSFVFERLKKELEKWGVVEPPIVIEKEGKLTVIAGHHRIRAWKALGHNTITVLKVDANLDKEDEFNLVNNLNLIKGEVTGSEIIKKVRENNLNVEKLDLFRFPASQLFPRLTSEDLTKKENEQERLAKINDLTLKVAKEIAKVMVEEKDELVTFLVVNDKACAAIRIPFKSGSEARKKAGDIKKKIQESLMNINDG